MSKRFRMTVMDDGTVITTADLPGVIEIGIAEAVGAADIDITSSEHDELKQAMAGGNRPVKQAEQVERQHGRPSN